MLKNLLSLVIIIPTMGVFYSANSQTIEANYKSPVDNLPTGVTVVQDANPHTQTQYLTKENADQIYAAFKEGTVEIQPSIDLYNAPMNHVNLNGRNKLDYLYSGDVNNSEVLDIADVQGILTGTSNDRAKVNLGTNVTASDATTLEKRINGEIKRIPGEAFMDINATPQEKKDLLVAFMNRSDFKSDWEIIQSQGGDCETAEFYAENRGRGIKDAEQHRLYVPGTKGKQSEGNMPIFGVVTKYVVKETGFEGNHAINGCFTGESNNTNITNLFNFGNYTFVEPQTGEIQKTGDSRLNERADFRYRYTDRDGNATGSQLNFDINDKNDVKVKQIHYNYALTNPKAIQTEFTENNEVINYQSNLDLEGKNMPEIKTNADLSSRVKTGTGLSSVNSRNILLTTVIEGDRTPLSEDPELANINYIQNRDIVVSYVQKSDLGVGKSPSILLKEERFNSPITVKDIEAPDMGIESNNVSISKNADPLEAIVVNHKSDNSGLDVTTNVYYNPAYTDGIVSQTATTKTYSVLIDGTDKSGNTSQPIEATVTQDLGTGIEELTATKTFDLDQNYPNPVNTTTTIPFASTGGDLDFKLIDMNGRVHKVIEKDNTYMGEGEFQLNMTGMTPGTYLLRVSNGNGKVETIKILKQ